MYGMVAGRRVPGWTAGFLAIIVLTSVTGFMFPFASFLPSHAVGAISVVLLAIALYALYGRHLAGAWRPVYVITALLALYLNVFVLVVQLFHRVPALIVAAPTQKEPPFVVSQLIMLALFVVLGIAAARRFRPTPGPELR